MATKISPIVSHNFNLSMLPKRYTTAISGFGDKKTGYVNTVCTFDIETTSDISETGEKIAYMYHWQLYINGYVVLGRNWDDLVRMLDQMADYFDPAKLVIYIQNFAFEFSFLQGVIPLSDVFATGPRNPIKAHYRNIEFRDAYILSGMGLGKLPTATKKLIGDLDYSRIRTPLTPLTPEEEAYCVNDVVVLAEYITDKLISGGDNLGTIPMTRTGYVRRKCREALKKANQIPKGLTMSPEDYEHLKLAYSGGFTHGAAYACGTTFHDVRSLDLTSSYPTVMVSEKYPISPFLRVVPHDAADLINRLKTSACLFRVELFNVRPRPTSYEHIISRSKCVNFDPNQDFEVDNGRIVRAEHITLWCNEIDYADISKFYDWDDTSGIALDDFYVAKKGRLPRALVLEILEAYAQKTILKGVVGILPDGTDAEIQYALHKEFINAIYGCTVTDPIKPDSLYGIWTDKDGHMWGPDWIPTEYQNNGDIAEKIDKHNRSRNRWGFYAWGVWCTSYARHNLFTMMDLMGPDYLYSDTDSLKILNYAKHKAEFDAYNDAIRARIKSACVDLGIDPALAEPRNRKGKVCPLGVWTDEGAYSEFKTLGAKRYLGSHELDDMAVPGYALREVTPTVAGAPKKALAAYLSKSGDPFGLFSDGLVIPESESGKNIHFFQPSDWDGIITDYMGQDCFIHAIRGSTAIFPTTVSLGLSEEYKIYLLSQGIKDWQKGPLIP